MKFDSSDFSPMKMIRFRVTLKGIEPPIWREFETPDDYTLSHLHDVLQIVMGWEDDHLHEFVIRGERFAPIIENNGWESRDVHEEENVDLFELKLRKRMKITYLYDFGDDWHHELEVLEIREASLDTPLLPLCLGGARACPPEDCGGAWRYTEIVDAIGNPDNPEHADIQEWIGEFNPEEFDVMEVNDMLERYAAEIECDEDDEEIDIDNLQETIEHMSSEELALFMKETMRSLADDAGVDQAEVDKIDFNLMLQTAELSQVCRERRESMGISITEMAKILGTKHSGIQALEGKGGEAFDPTLCIQYVTALGLSDWFAKWKDANPKIAGLFNTHP